ncbi:MAG: lauroyl-Kdo(2)-lipid IV(A) myristoyltransferase [Ferrimonas sp.]
MKRSDISPHAPAFSWRFLAPANWGYWFFLVLIGILAWLPYRVRNALGSLIGRICARPNNKTRQRAEVNLARCFPEWSDAKREQVILDTCIRGAQSLLALGIGAVRNKAYLDRHVRMHGAELMLADMAAGKPVVMLVPHCWAIEVVGQWIASEGYAWTAMMKPHSNPLLDWAMLLGRSRYPGRLYTRAHGIRPMLESIKQGYAAYYLPDQDHGMAKSEYVPFFATHKATLPGLGKMVEETGATIYPVYATYDPKTGLFEGHVQTAIQDLPSGDKAMDARILNRELEKMISIDPCQYMWTLKLLQSNPHGLPSPYIRKRK